MRLAPPAPPVPTANARGTSANGSALADHLRGTKMEVAAIGLFCHDLGILDHLDSVFFDDLAFDSNSLGGEHGEFLV